MLCGPATSTCTCMLYINASLMALKLIHTPKQWNLNLDLFHGGEQHDIVLLMAWKFLHLFSTTTGLQSKNVVW